MDIIAGGFPCQDVSLAGRRAGMTEGTRSNLWGAMRSAVEIIRPAYVVAENVRGLLSAHAESASDMEPGTGLLGDRSGGHLRALGRVLGDLADLGYDTQWCGLRASDVGAPTTASACSSSPPAEMFRTPAAAEAEGGALSPERARVENRTLRLTGQILDMVAPEQMSDSWKALKTPTSQLAVNGGSQHPDKRKAGGHGPTLADEVEHLLPTPTAMNPNEDEDMAQWQARRARVKAEKKNGNGFGMPLGIAVRTLSERTGAPTPPPSTDGSPSWEDVPLPLPSSPNAESTDSPPASPNG